MNWNELEFTNIKDYKRMAPAIIQLEINRIGSIIDSLQANTFVHNNLVKARYELKQFSEAIKNNFNYENLNSHLLKAIFFISKANENSTEEFRKTLLYVLDRLSDLNNKSNLLIKN